MMNIKVDSTKTTPQVNFANGHIYIMGRSIPFVDPGFYNSLIKMISDYALNPALLTIIEINLECMNAYSKRSMMQVFRILEQIQLKGYRVIVNWAYIEEDESMLELGVIYQSIVNLPFNIISK